jgi:hypothetical protein
LPQRVEDVRSELRGFVQEEDSAVGQAQRARPGQAGAAAHQRRRGGGVVRCLERRSADQARHRRQGAGDRVHRGHLERAGVVQRRQDRGEPLGQHGLAGARWSEQGEMVRAGGGDLQGEPAAVLADDVGEVERVHVLGTVHCGWFGQRDAGPGELDDLAELLGAADLYAGDQGRLGGVVGRHDDAPDAGPRRRERHRQHAAHGADLPVEAELADEGGAADGAQLEFAGRPEHHECDGQVEAGAVLGKVSREQVDGDAPLRPLLVGVDDRGADPVAGLVERGVGQAGERQRGQARRDIGLDRDAVALESDQTEGAHPGVSHATQRGWRGSNCQDREQDLWTARVGCG